MCLQLFRYAMQGLVQLIRAYSLAGSLDAALPMHEELQYLTADFSFRVGEGRQDANPAGETSIGCLLIFSTFRSLKQHQFPVQPLTNHRGGNYIFLIPVVDSGQQKVAISVACAWETLLS